MGGQMRGPHGGSDAGGRVTWGGQMRVTRASRTPLRTHHVNAAAPGRVVTGAGSGAKHTGTRREGEREGQERERKRERE
eukprot:1976668-Prymnesium_polylepis.1